MRNFRFWLPAIAGTLITPVLLFVAAVSTRAGHGSYAAAFVLYPLSIVILVLFAGVSPSDAFAAQTIQTISTALVVGLAILQFPLYGFVLSYARLKSKWWLTLIAGVICLHLLGIAVWVVIAGIMCFAVGS